MRILVFAMSALLGQTLLAQTTQTTQKAEADLSTPKASAFAFAQALESGDSAAVRRLVVGGDKNHEALFDSLARLYGSTAALRRSAIAKWGEEAKGITAMPGMHDTADLLRRVELSEVKVEGDVAEVYLPAPTRLRKVDGKWLIDAPATFNLQPKQLADLIGLYEAVSAAAVQTAEEIGKGQYQEIGEARRAFMGRAVRKFAATKGK